MAMSEALSSQEVHAAWAKLADDVRTGVLLTLRDGRPFGSHVPYVFGEHWTCAYIHVSRLALHTEHLLRDSRVGLFVSEPGRFRALGAAATGCSLGFGIWSGLPC
jgi:heme iron utilization protein